MKKNLGVYIHWPFCVSKCPYCDFNSHIRRSIDEDAWCKAILTELDYYFEKTSDYQLMSIFFGGGTPSLMAPQTVEKIIRFITKKWSFEKFPEITLEANPNSVEVEKFHVLKDAGVNRISLGIQSLRAENLKFLGRSHSLMEAKKAIETAHHVFSNFSFDLIYALPKQTLHDWENELLEALTFSSKHLSLYQLTIEQGTPFYKQYHRGDWSIPSHQQAADFYIRTQEIMNDYHLSAYEISNHARVDFECRHNLIYWCYQTFLGIGPGAHGRIIEKNMALATQNYKAPKKWLDCVANKKNGCEEELVLTQQEMFEEKVLMGLRLNKSFYFYPEDEQFLNIKNLNFLHQEGFLQFDEDQRQICVLQKGRFVLNEVIKKILT